MDNPPEHIRPSLGKYLKTFALVSVSLLTGALIAVQIDELESVVSGLAGPLIMASLSFVGLEADRQVIAAAELIFLIGAFVTIMTAWAAHLAVNSVRARLDLETTRRRLELEVERQKTTSDELHITHQQLSSTARQLGGILEGTTDLIAAVDLSLSYISFNEAYRDNIKRLFGQDIRLGMRIDEALGSSPSKREEATELWKRALSGEKFEAIQEFTSADGTIYYYESTYNPIFDDAENVSGAARISRDVTERRNTEIRIRREMEFVSAAVDANSSLVIVLDLEGRIIRFNQACEKISGYSSEEVLGRVFWNILVPTEDIARIKASFRGFESTFFTEDYVNRWVTRDEKIKLISWQVSPIKDENGYISFVVGTGIDITEKREFETARNRMLKILENSPDLVAVYDFQGRLTYLNSSGKSLLGLSENVDTQRLRLTSHQPDWVNDLLQAEAIPAAVKEGSWLGTTAILDSNGEEVPVSQLILAHQNEKGQVEYFSTVIRDISRQKQMEEHLAEARDGALAAIRNKSEFLANMSHEIRTPMSGIIGISELLLDTPLSDDQRDYAETIQRCGESLLTIINDILDFSKLEAGKLQFEETEFDLNELVDSVVELFAQSIYQKGLELSVLVNREVPTSLKGDPGRIRQILTNLVSNAVKFTDEGEIVVRVFAEGHGERPVFRFSVSDSGIGISESARDSLFQPYSQVKQSASTDYGGTGLGLAICKQIVGLLGGEMGVESEPGKGSMFWFAVPLDVQPEAEFGEEIESLKGLRVLIVDDNDTNRRIVLHQTKVWGINAEEAGSGKAGLALLRAAARNKEAFHAVMADLNMPGLSGLDMAGEIRKDPLLRNTAMILMASPAERSRITDEQKDMVGPVVAKPVRLKELLAALTSLPPAAANDAFEDKSGSDEYAALVKDLEAQYGDDVSAKILIAEDNMVNRKVLYNQIIRMGYRADVVGNGREAVEAFKRNNYSLILMDCEMPEMDGVEATKRIRGLERPGSHVPIIAVTAHVLNSERMKCFAAGMDDYLNKPTRMKVLSQTVTKWIRYPQPENDEDAEAPAENRSNGITADEDNITARLLELQEDCGPEVVAECIGLFEEDLDRVVERLKEALSKGDLEQAANDAHKLKGSTANMGAERLSEIAAEMTSLARNDEPGECLLKLEEFTAAARALAPLYSEHGRRLSTEHREGPLA